jgi:hypothetical protein
MTQVRRRRMRREGASEVLEGESRRKYDLRSARVASRLALWDV